MENYPLYFEANNLTEREREKVWRYFQKKRDSGGGECGQIEQVGDNCYKICFLEKEVQERVLLRKSHTISLPRGELTLTVNPSNMTQNPKAANQGATGSQQVFTQANKKELEKVFPMDFFLLSYLKDSPKASKALHKQLSSIDCSIDLNLEQDEAVVRGEIEKGPGGSSAGSAEKWEARVDWALVSLLESYLCYHVVEADKLKLLLQDLSFVTEDLRVYRQPGYAVVVGEVAEVKEKIAQLEKSVPIRTECAIPENKYNLVEEEFNREILTKCPGVKIHKTVPNKITLEGPDKEVQSSCTKLYELVKNIKEKTIDLPLALLNFLTSSGILSSYQSRFRQSLRSPVTLEIGSKLVLCSLSSGALEEAAATVQRELCVETVQLEGTVAAAQQLDDLKETLARAKNQINQHGFRVEVSYHQVSQGTPKNKVELVGYIQDVGRLKDILMEYKLNQVETQEQLALPRPEMVDMFDKILLLLGMKQPRVKITASHSPSPCVLLSGPRCLVQETLQDLRAALALLSWKDLVLDGPGAHQYFQNQGKRSMELVEGSCQVLITEKQGVTHNINHGMTFGWQNRTSPTSSNATLNTSTTRGQSNTIGSPSKPSLEIKLGNLEDQQVSVLVAPMNNITITSTNIGKGLLKKGGAAMQTNFDLMARRLVVSAGDVLQVDGPPSLDCSKIFFVECLPWGGAEGQSVKALRKGLKSCLDFCEQQGWTSVALPVIGPGLVLKYRLRPAVEILTEEICQFGQNTSTGSVSNICVVIQPDYPDSKTCYHDVYADLSSNMNRGGQAIFQSLTSDLDDITVALGGGVQLQLVFGDISNETTDVVVNSTDFRDFETPSVCKDILVMAGPQVKARLNSAQVKRGEIFVTESGQFPCQAIFHVCGQNDAGVIKSLVHDIIESCEEEGHRSVAIPAIGSGLGKMDPDVVADAILKGVKDVVTSAPLHCVTTIRLVLIEIKVFLAFKKLVPQFFGSFVPSAGRLIPSLVAPAPQNHPPPSMSPDLSILLPANSSISAPHLFLIVGTANKDIARAEAELNKLYRDQCSKHTFTREELANLPQEDVNSLSQSVETLGLRVEPDQASPGGLTVSGLKDGINQWMNIIHVSNQGTLRREVRNREEDDLYGTVAWCILGATGDWERLPKTANYKLEKGDLSGGVVDGHQANWSVDRSKKEAKARGTGKVTQLKRLDIIPDFSDFSPLLYWDNMAADEQLKKVILHPTSVEYKRVKEGFKRTATNTVLKIERLQNVHLRRGYEVRKKQISDKNRGGAGAGEKMLYHGTTHENCQSIMDTGYNRRFAGQNATAYGLGTYFAVDASYSANPTYSQPGQDGSRLMFVARVLTGSYTQGQNDMKVPPPRNPQQPNDRFDSVVNNEQNPTMFVVFHDNQAYPDYLITFK